MIAIPTWGEMESQCCFDLHFLMSEDVEHLFMYLLAICTSCFEKCLFNSFAHLLIELLVLLVVNFWSALHIMDVNPLFDEKYYFTKISLILWAVL
jgi:hypothetical protein